MYESNRITVQLLILLLAVFVTCNSFGCSGSDHTSVPVALNIDPPFSYSGRIGRTWGGDNFEVVDNGQLHYAFVRGIDTPEPGQKFFDEAKAMLWQLSLRKQTTVHVIGHDDWKREVCDLQMSDPKTGEVIDPAYELLRCGLAWFDQSEGPYQENYREAEAQAKKEKIGIWSQSNPVPPWEYWEQQMKHLQ